MVILSANYKIQIQGTNPILKVMHSAFYWQRTINIVRESAPKYWTSFLLEQLGHKLEESIPVIQDKWFPVAKSS